MATSVQMNPCYLIMSKLCCVFVLTWMIVCITLLLRNMVVLWLAAKSRSPWKLQAPNLHLVMQLWTSSNRLRYVNSAKTLSSVNYINYWSRFWRLKRCMLISVPLPVPTWTPYSVKVFSFLISIGASFYFFIYFILFLLSRYLRSFADFIGDNYCIEAHLE